MAIYHCNIIVASRSDGSSAVAGAAYIARAKIEDERTGVVHDFRYAHRHERLVADLGISAPDGAPERWQDRSVFWNEVEAVEKGPRAQVARRIECALPDELNDAQTIELARAIVADRVADGHVVDACVHQGVDGTNYHLHMLEPLRACDEDGLLPKSETVYLVRDKIGDERRLSARELKNEKAIGAEYEKVYLYKGGRELTKTEADAAGLDPIADRVRRQSVMETRYLTDWNERERAEEWREAIAMRCNEALERAGFDERVDHRSYERQGIDREPGRHEGPQVTHMEERAEREARDRGERYEPVTDRRLENVEIMQRREAIEQIARQVQQVRAELARVEQQIAAERTIDPGSERAQEALELSRAARDAADRVEGMLDGCRIAYRDYMDMPSDERDAIETRLAIAGNAVSSAELAVRDADYHVERAQERVAKAEERVERYEQHPLRWRAELRSARMELDSARDGLVRTRGELEQAKQDLSQVREHQADVEREVADTPVARWRSADSRLEGAVWEMEDAVDKAQKAVGRLDDDERERVEDRIEREGLRVDDDEISSAYDYRDDYEYDYELEYEYDDGRDGLQMGVGAGDLVGSIASGLVKHAGDEREPNENERHRPRR